MTDSTATETVRDFWRLFEARRFDDLCRDRLAMDCEFVMPGAPPMRGVAAVRGMFEAYVRAFPDFAARIVHAVESGDTYAAETAFTGTHRAPLATPQGEIAPTGRAVSWQSADIIRVAGGRIVSWHAYHDTLPLLAQLGVAGG